MALLLIIFFVLSSILLFGAVLWLKERRPPNFPPGPVGLPFVGYLPFLYGGNPLQKIGQLSAKYGSTFSMKIGPDWWVVLTQLDSIKKAHALEAVSGRPRHMTFMRNNIFGIGYNEGPAWHEQRAFTVGQMKELGYAKRMESMMYYEANELVNDLRRKTTTTGSSTSLQALDMQNALGPSLLNLALLMNTGTKFKVNDPKLVALWDEVRLGFLEPDLDPRLIFLPTLATTFSRTSKYGETTQHIVAVNNAVREIIRRHRSSWQHGARRDFVDAYIDKMGDVAEKARVNEGAGAGAGQVETSFLAPPHEGEENFVDTVGNLIVATTITLTSTLSFAVLYLTRHRSVLRRLQAELAAVTGGQRAAPSYSERNRLPYLEAVIAETLRLSSIAIAAALHSTTERVHLDGYTLPNGTVVMGHLYAVHHDPALWGDPEQFRPERFLDFDEPEGDACGRRLKREELSHVNAFGVGKRSCVGKNVAPVILFNYIAALVQGFDFEEAEGHPLPALDPRPAIVLCPGHYRVSLTPKPGAPKHRPSSYAINAL